MDSTTNETLLEMTSIGNAEENTSNKPYEGYNEVSQSVSILILILGLIAIVINLLVLLASKCTTGGRDSILVFIRSLCVADTLLGIYGVLKFIFITHRPPLINCFLPDALLICAFLAGNFTLVGLLADCSKNIMHYIYKTCKRPNSKYRTIFLIVYLWNGAFILAFLPQMGWNFMPYTCAFFKYHSVYYISFISVIFFTCVLLMLAYTCKVGIFLRKLLHEPNTPPHVRLELVKIHTIVVTSRVDVTLQLTAFLPLVFYILLHCHSCIYHSNAYTETYFLCLIPIILLKSIIVGIIRGKRTSQIAQVFYKQISLIYSLVERNKHKQNSQDIFHIETPENTGSTEQTSASDTRDTYFSYSMYRYAVENQYGANGVKNSGSKLLPTGRLPNGLYNHITTKHRPIYVCAHCGHLYHCVMDRHHHTHTDRRHSNNIAHPLQVLYGKKHWPKSGNFSNGGSYAYDNNAFCPDNNEVLMKGVYQRRVSETIEKSPAFKSHYSHGKTRANSLESVIPNGKTNQNVTLLMKSRKLSDLPKVVTFKETAKEDDSIESCDLQTVISEGEYNGNIPLEASVKDLGQSPLHTNSVVVDIEPQLHGILKNTHIDNDLPST